MRDLPPPDASTEVGSRADPRAEFFAVTPDELAEMVRRRREFLVEYVPKHDEAERLAKQDSDERVLEPGENERTAYQRLLEVRRIEDEAKRDRETLETDLKLQSEPQPALRE